ncbi:Aste57867_14158 [Aphanomyces stellatus]|uniref:Aste57867_14158 protein n=1 Tax=Aphanomyces stellatus TaxID=120398 RepID=A0A485L0W0_9STRA|nr:hypothetical protein As57867_014107 [Aphanomyces stellatus]VFT90984.1 Aste57867_14158 [Aphanomyces stellatus]
MLGHADGNDVAASWSTEDWALRLGAIVVLVLLAAVLSGLTLGLMGLDKVGLEVVIAAGDEPTATPKEKQNAAYARKIRPLRHDGHLLLTTLLFGNVAVNSIMAIFMAELTSGFVGFLVTTVVLVIFGELVPQALCSKYPLGPFVVIQPSSSRPLAIGAKALPIVYLLIGIMYIFAKPIAMALDCIVGKDIGTIFTKCELEKMLDIHVKQKKLDDDELEIMKGAMYFKKKSVSTVMTPVADAYMLPGPTRLDMATIEAISAMGFSRVPVYGADINDVLGVILVKDLIFVDPTVACTAADFFHLFGRSVHRVWPDSTLGDVLAAFKLGRTHLAIVHDVNNWSESDPFYETQGVVSLEDIVEEILQDEIYDEGDVVDAAVATRNKRLSRPSFDTGVRHVMDQNTTRKSIGEPEARALATHLVATNAVFRVPDANGQAMTAATVAALLLRCPVFEYDQEEVLFERGAVANHCIIVLQGSVTVASTIYTQTAGLWTVQGANSLIQLDGAFVSDVSVKTPQKYTRCLRLSRLEFQCMLRPTVHVAKDRGELMARRQSLSSSSSAATGRPAIAPLPTSALLDATSEDAATSPGKSPTAKFRRAPSRRDSLRRETGIRDVLNYV